VRHNEQIPAPIKDFAGIANHMLVAAIFSRQQITGPGVVPGVTECPPHYA
jgi:hypothetical protein